VVESLRPLTLLLGGALLWALCLLVLALGGLGTRFATPTLESPLAPLPKVSIAATRSRLGAWENYGEVASRPLMNEGRKPSVVTAVANDGASSELDVTLTSVLITSRLQLAVLTDNKDGSSRRVKLGEAVEGSNWRLVGLEPRQAVLEGPTGQRMLPLRVFDGSSGEAPTALTSSASANANEQAAQATQTGPAPPPRSPPPAPVAQNAPPSPAVSRPDPNQMTQEQQVEAIRARIEARRAQMRAEADAAAKQQSK
jgi:general secretion pathway protein N